jgi:hypothetical protein
MATVEITVVSEKQPPTLGQQAFIRNAVHKHLQSKPDEDDLRWLLSHDSAPEDLLLELCERGLCIDELGHRKGPRRLLEKLADEHHYPEAIITLAAKLYADPAESDDSFRSFVQQHFDCAWMLESLSHLDPSSAKKEVAYLAVAGKHPDQLRFTQLQEARLLEKEAKTTIDAEAIDRLFKTREPQAWRGLANNPAVPTDMLAELASVKGLRYAREIRDRAKRNLAARKGA